MKRTARKQDERFDVTTHFKFGENWASYAQNVREEEITRAQEGLLNLLPARDWQGRSILDIGCGSGLHALAMLRLGAASVLCTDIDAQSVATTQKILQHFAPGQNWQVVERNILLQQEPLPEGAHDIVYSWGALHHTGALWAALDHAALCVRARGLLVVALYKKTPLCGFWRAEKRFYKRASGFVRRLCEGIYATLYGLAYTARGGNFAAYLKNYQTKRGMDFMTDVRDWLGGYPYESASPDEVREFMAQRGFTLEKSLNAQPVKVCGFFGSGCAEYVFRKNN